MVKSGFDALHELGNASINGTDMKTLDVVNSRLIFVSGKGGVGKTCLAVSLGKTSAALGRKTLVVEVDNFHPSFPPIFGKENQYQPVNVERNLDMCNIT